MRSLLLALAANKSVENRVRRSRLWAPIVRRFVAGEAMEDLVTPVRELSKAGIAAILSYLGENVENRNEAQEAVDYYHRLFHFAAEQKLDAYVSLKLTQLGLDISNELALSNLSALVASAGENGLFVRVDMEGSAYVERTLEIVCSVRKEHENVGTVLQAYLHRSIADLDAALGSGLRIRLVKGAYREPDSVAIQRMPEIRERFTQMTCTMLQSGVQCAIATHDEGLIEATRTYAASHSILPDAYEFQMLYGVRRDLQKRLVGQGHGVRVYVPFGTQWYPYMTRRMAERPSNLWFVLRNLLRR